MQGRAASFHVSPSYTHKDTYHDKTLHSTMTHFNPTCKGRSNTFIKHDIPWIFFHHNRRSRLKNNTWSEKLGTDERICIRMCVCVCEERKVSDINLTLILKYYEVPVLTTIWIITVRGRRRYWMTLLCPSLLVTCTLVTSGLPYLARLEDRHTNTFKIQSKVKILQFSHWRDKGTNHSGLTEWSFTIWRTREETC